MQSPGDVPDQAVNPAAETDSILNTMTSITKQRVKLNIKVLGVQLGEKDDETLGNAGVVEGEKRTSREQFKAPEMSIVSKLMGKVRISTNYLQKFLHCNQFICIFLAIVGW